MKYLKKFNEDVWWNTLADGLPYNPTKRPLTCGEDFKEFVEEVYSISHILQDGGIDPSIGPDCGEEFIRISLNTRAQLNNIFLKDIQNRGWDSLVNNDVYMEYIDRLKDICENDGYKIYVQCQEGIDRSRSNAKKFLSKWKLADPVPQSKKYQLYVMLLFKYPITKYHMNGDDLYFEGKLFVPIELALSGLTKPGVVQKFKNMFK